MRCTTARAWRTLPNLDVNIAYSAILWLICAVRLATEYWLINLSLPSFSVYPYSPRLYFKSLPSILNHTYKKREREAQRWKSSRRHWNPPRWRNSTNRSSASRVPPSPSSGPAPAAASASVAAFDPPPAPRKKLLVYDLSRSPPSPPPPHAFVASLSRIDLSPRAFSPFPSAYRLSLSSPLPSPSSSSSTTSSLTQSPSSINSPGTPGPPFVHSLSPRLTSHLEPTAMIYPSSSPPTFLFATLPEPSESTASPSSSGPDEATTSPVEKNKKIEAGKTKDE